MSEAIYQEAIKTLAQAGHGAGRLEAPDGSARVDTPLCGDRVTVDVRLADGRIAALAHETKGCLLCRAAAAIVALHAGGKGGAEIAATQRELSAMLRAGGPVPAGWEELAAFAPVARHPSRHGCVLLPFQALEAALAATGLK